MNLLEENLRKALGRKPAPEGFADRVIAHARQQPEPAARRWRQLMKFAAKPVFRWAFVTAAVLLVIAAGVVHRQRQERLRAEGEMARAQVRQALRIASVKLNVARKKVRDINREAPPSQL